MSNATGRIDFHLHSYASNVTDYYAANAFAIPESHSDPLALYPLLKQRGMTLVTLTDHNSINGALEMLDAGLADVFISALELEVGVLLSSPDFRAALAGQKATDDRIFLVISSLVNRIFARYLSNLKNQRPPNMRGGIKEIVALVP